MTTRPSAERRSDSDPYRHDAFISYSTRGTATVGAALEYGIEMLGRSWDEARALDVFRDVSDQPAIPDLADDLMRHLDGSRYLVFVSSPEAAASTWVADELAHWIDRRGVDGLILTIARGTLAWKDGAFTAESTLPPLLRTAFPAEPKWVDLSWTDEPGFDPTSSRFVDNVADISAIILGKSKSELVGLHWDVRRRNLARRLAENADVASERDPTLGLLLAAEANELDDNPMTRRALASVLESTGGIRATLGAERPVTAIAYTPSNGGGLMVGRDDGSIAEWDATLAAPTGERVPGPTTQITALATSTDGTATVVGYADGTLVVEPASGDVWTRVAGHDPCDVVAVDDGGAIVAVSCDESVRIARRGESHAKPVASSFTHVRALRFVDAETLHVYDWSEVVAIDASTLDSEPVARVPALPRPGPVAFSHDGRWQVWTQLDGGGINVSPVFETADAEPFIEGPKGFIDAVGLAPGAGHVVESIDGSLLAWEADADWSNLRWEHPSALGNAVEELVVGPAASWAAIRGGGKCELHIENPHTLSRRFGVESGGVPSVVQAALDAAFSPDDDVVAWIANPSSVLDVAPILVLDIDAGVTSELPAQRPSLLHFVTESVLRVDDVDGGTTWWDVRTLDTVDAGAVSDADDRTEPDPPDDAQHPEWGVVRAHAADPSSARVARAYSEGVVALTETEANVVEWVLAFPSCSDLRFDPGGGTLAMVSYGGRLVLVDADSGEVGARLDVQDGPTHRLRFSHSGDTLAVVTPGGPLTVVDVSVASWRTMALARAGRQLSPAERDTFGISELPRLPD